MKTRSKGKELLKVAMVCVLSVSMFSAAFVGFNQLIFARATNEPTPLPPTVEAVTFTHNTANVTTSDASKPEAEAEVEIFTNPALTLIESADQHFHSIPASAMSMDDAAQTGARYIRDVFGANIDGMYVQLFFAAHASQINTWWVGHVFVEDPSNPTQNYFVHTTTDEITALPVYMFVINGITGQRIDVRYMGQQGRVAPTVHGNSDRGNARMALVETGWFDMDINEQLAFAGISDNALESYTQTVTSLAQAQFNISGVSNVQFSGLSANGVTDGVVDIAVLNFTALDNTGREAIISIPVTGAEFRSMSISTQHNDFIPGFELAEPVTGRG